MEISTDQAADDNNNVDFISSLSSPLRDYAEKCCKRSSPNDDESKNPASQATQQRSLLDEFEISVRSHLLQLIEHLLYNQNDNDDAALISLLTYIKQVALLCHHLVCNKTSSSSSSLVTSSATIPKLPFLIIEDTITSLPLSLLQQAWSYSSSNHDNDNKSDNSNNNNNDNNNLAISSHINNQLLTSPHLFLPSCKFVLLRICNTILRQLSNRDVHANFAGEIRTLLARVFPLSERSAVNVLGGFNVGNVTRMERLEEFRHCNNGSGGGGSVVVGYEFYTKFWGLQKVFTDPAGTVLSNARGTTTAAAAAAGNGSERVQAYETFVKDVMDVLEALEGTPIVDATADTTTTTSSSSSSLQFDRDKNQQQEHVRHHKYLTSSKLLHLQLKDPTLRTHFLTQLLIILSYLTTLPPSSALPTGVQSTAGADTSKLMAQIRQTQLKQLGGIEKRVQKLLVQATTATTTTSTSSGNDTKRSDKKSTTTTTTNTNGKMWKATQWILRDRESMWKNWKKAKCLPAMDRNTPGGIVTSVDGSDIEKLLLGRKRKLGQDEKEVSTNNSSSSNDMLTMETLAKQHTSEIKAPTTTTTTLSSFLDPYIEALDPENGIEGEYHPRNDKVYSWRALRLMARDQTDGQLRRFGKLRRNDGDFEGIVRDIWLDRGEEIPGGLDDDYYKGNELEEEEEEEEKNGGKDAAMDDVSVGSTQEEVDAKKKEEEAKKKRQAEFEKAAMEVEEDILEKTDEKNGGSSSKNAAAAAVVDEGEKKPFSYRDLAVPKPKNLAAKEPVKQQKKNETSIKGQEEKKVAPKAESKATEKKTEPTKQSNGKDTKKEEKGNNKFNSTPRSTPNGKKDNQDRNGSGQKRKDGDNGKKGGNRGSNRNAGSNSNNNGNNNNNNNNNSEKNKNDSRQQSRSRAKFTPPQNQNQNQKKSEGPPRDNSNSRGGGGGGGGGGGRRGGNDRRGGNNMPPPPPPQSRGGNNRDGRAHTPPNGGPRGGMDQRGMNNGPRGGGGGGGGGGPGRGWEPPPGKGFHPGQGGGGGGRGGGGRGGPDRRRHGRR